MKNKILQSNKNSVAMTVNTGSEFRAEKRDEAMTISGYAVVFDSEYKYKSWDGKEWTEKVDRDAFDGVDFSRVLLLRDHDYKRVLGRAGKNLTLSVDNIGLFFRCDLPNTELARETFELAEAEICDQCSFGFTLGEVKTDFGNRVETITKIDRLYEITVTPIPAYKETVVVTLNEKRQEKLDIEADKREKAKAEEEAERLRLEAEKKKRIDELYKNIEETDDE